MTWIDAPSNVRGWGATVVPSASSDQARASFAAMLDPVADAPDRDVAHARGFGELGVFGHRYREPGSAGPKPVSVSSENAANSVAEPAAPVAARADELQQEGSGSAGADPVASVGETGGEPVLPARRADALATPNGVAALTTPLVRTATAERHKPGAGRPGASSPSFVVAERRDGPKIVVGGEDNMLNVIARLPGNDAAAELRLRRRIGEIAAEFGFKLSGIHLNGSSIEPDFATMTGGPYGTRTR